MQNVKFIGDAGVKIVNCDDTKTEIEIVINVRTPERTFQVTLSSQENLDVLLNDDIYAISYDRLEIMYDRSDSRIQTTYPDESPDGDTSRVYHKSWMGPLWGDLKKLWVFEDNEGTRYECRTQEEACKIQREYRVEYGYNPYSGHLDSDWQLKQDVREYRDLERC